MEIKNKVRWVYNPHKKIKIIKDLNIRVPGLGVIDLEKQIKDPTKIYRSVTYGHTYDMLIEGDLMQVNEPTPISRPKFFMSKVPAPSRIYCMTNQDKEAGKFFIEALEEEWQHDGFGASEEDNVRNLDKIMDLEDLDQFDDPSDRKW